MVKRDQNKVMLNLMSGNDGKISTNDKEEEINDLPFESVKPRMTKNQLIETILGKKTRRVIKTVKIKDIK